MNDVELKNMLAANKRDRMAVLKAVAQSTHGHVHTARGALDEYIAEVTGLVKAGADVRPVRELMSDLVQMGFVRHDPTSTEKLTVSLTPEGLQFLETELGV